MQNFLSDFISPNLANTTSYDDFVTWNVTELNIINGDFNPRGFIFVQRPANTTSHLNQNPSIINGWQFLGVEQNLSTTPEELFWLVHEYSEEPRHAFREGSQNEEARPPPTHRIVAQFLHSSFHLNASVTSRPGVIPYNSTLWYNGTRTSLEAPFLGFRNWCVRRLPFEISYN